MVRRNTKFRITGPRTIRHLLLKAGRRNIGVNNLGIVTRSLFLRTIICLNPKEVKTMAMFTTPRVGLTSIVSMTLKLTCDDMNILSTNIENDGLLNMVIIPFSILPTTLLSITLLSTIHPNIIPLSTILLNSSTIHPNMVPPNTILHNTHPRSITNNQLNITAWNAPVLRPRLCFFGIRPLNPRRKTHPKQMHSLLTPISLISGIKAPESRMIKSTTLLRLCQIAAGSSNPFLRLRSLIHCGSKVITDRSQVKVKRALLHRSLI